MYRVVNILKYFIILAISVSVLLFSASLLLKDKVAGMILSSFTKDLSTKVHFGSFRLSFLKKFPKASVEMRDVLVNASEGFDKSDFPWKNKDTLLAARFVSFDFSITDILRRNYNIERMSVRTGKINLLTDSAGHINYELYFRKASSSGKNIAINLEKISLSDVNLFYNSLSVRLLIDGVVKNGKIKSKISTGRIDFSTNTGIVLNRLQLYGMMINKTLKGNLDLTLQSSDKGVFFRKGTLRLKDYDFGIEGMVDAGRIIDLRITGHNFDLSDITDYLPDKLREKVQPYNPAGKIAINCLIKGSLTKSSAPHVEINCLLAKGSVSSGNSDLSLSDLSFAGSYSNGAGNSVETSSLSIKNFRAKLGSAQYTGSVSVKGFDNPNIAVALQGRLFPAELKKFFALGKLSHADGSADMDLKIEGPLSRTTALSISDIIDLKPEIKLAFHSLTAGSDNRKLLFSRVNGNLSMSGTVVADNLEFIFGGQKIKVNGEFTNLPEWLEGRPVQLGGAGEVSFSRFIPEQFFNLRGSPASSTKRRAVILPGDLKLDLGFKIDTLIYNSFFASAITGKLSYTPGLLTFKSLNMHSLDGIISGNGIIVQNKSKAFYARGTVNVSQVDINKSFITFHNFGQNFLKAENIEGVLTGAISFLLPLDSLLNPQYKSVSAEGNFILLNGALISFDPVKHLSAFIELSELQNIRFDRMENDFFIRNNLFFIPQMEIRSSAAKLTVNGKHSFDDDYEYHVRILLSEILSRKRKKNGGNVSEYGVIEDDGAGRTSILLKIIGKGEDARVSYDLKAAGNIIKNNIRTERQKLKTILNEEYGFYKSDSSVNRKPEPKKKRFRITWDENDSLKAKPATDDLPHKNLPK